MDKCWFVLPQTHYPPPQDNSENGGFGQTGPICLGHFIKDLRHLDQVINPGSPEPFPLDMPIYRTRPIDFEWEENKEHSFDIAATAEVPIGAAAGVTAKASLGWALKQTVSNYWQIDHLDTMVVQPTRSYIDLCLASAPVAEFLESVKLGPTWSIFMITGLKVVRGNSSHRISRGRERGIHGGPGVGVAEIAKVTTDGGISSQQSISVSAKYTHDFVWAARFSKITKGLFVKNWRQKTYSKDATFGMDDSSTGMEHIKDVLLEEGLPYSEIFNVNADGADEELFIVPENY